MTPTIISGAKHVLKAPKNWNEKKLGKCMDLHIRGGWAADKLPLLSSAWLPTEKELGQLSRGAPIILEIIGAAHPPVMLRIGSIEDLAIMVEAIKGNA